MIPFEDIAQRLLTHSESFCRNLFPAGIREGQEFRIGNIRGDKGRSLSINLTTGVWKDFAADDAGSDLISLYAAVHGLSQADAARSLAPEYANGHDHRSGPTPVTTKPTSPPDIQDAEAVYRYTDTYYVARFSRPNGKTFTPYTWDGSAWNRKAPPKPRPLYGLDDLASRPDSPVLIVEGEKCRDVAQASQDVYTAVTWHGGAQAVGTANWAVLTGRDVTIWPDADDPGRKAGKTLVSILLPICSSVTELHVGDKAEGWDIADAIAEGTSPIDFIKSTPKSVFANGSGNAPPQSTNFDPPQPPPFEDGYIEALVASSPLTVPRGTSDAEKPAIATPIPDRQRIPWAGLDGDVPPAREWILEHWIPASRDTLLAGKGGIGKTLFAQCLCTALAIGVDYVDEINSPKTSLFWAGEDDVDELWRRQININREMGATMAQIDQRMHVMDYANADITLAATVYGTLYPTPLMEELRQQVNDYKVNVVWLDNIARIYGGNENDRHQVTQFMSWLRTAVAPAALVLLAHPAKIAGSEFSGSTAWEGAVRARLWMSEKHPDEKPADYEDDSADPNIRYISKRKANYSANDVRRMVLMNGVLVPDKPPERGTPRTVGNDLVKDTIRRAIRALSEREIYPNESTASPNFLPKLMKQYGLLDRAAPGHVTAVVREMIMAGELVKGEVGKNSNRTPKMGLKLPE